MNIIVEGNINIRSAMSRSYHNDIKYKASKYMIHCVVEDGTLLFNLITGEVILLSTSECDAIEHITSGKEQVLSELVKHGFLVPDDCIEEQSLEQIRSIFLKEREQKHIITYYNVLTTTACNARCFYCYEHGIKKRTMSIETADNLVKFIQSHHGNKKILFGWFGGEPTLGVDCIDYICTKMIELGIPFTSQMVSNAYLFDQDMIKRAKERWNLKKIQITLDGTEEIYNRTKAYVNISDNAYKRVLRNIGLFLDEQIDVNIRLNMDEHNIEDLRKLVDELGTLFGGRKNLAIYVRLLKENAGANPIKHCQEDRARLGRYYFELQDKLEQNGWSQIWKFSLPNLKPFSCMADDPFSIQVTPDGILSKCEDRIYDKVVGTLEDGITDTKQMKWWQERRQFEECKNCPLLPSCTKLLKNCPVRTPECDINDKEKRIQLCYDTMKKEYEQWKKCHNN